jgi:hypothetical protein
MDPLDNNEYEFVTTKYPVFNFKSFNDCWIKVIDILAETASTLLSGKRMEDMVS